MSGEQIQVSSLSLTVLKFSSKITHYEFDNKQDYAGQIRNSDNSFVVRVSGNQVANTNLYISEGSRGHWFVVRNIGDSIDLNKVKLFKDYSDLKYVKQLIAQEQQQQADALAITGNVKKDNDRQIEKKKKEFVNNAKKDSASYAVAEQKRLAKIKEETEQQKALEVAKHAQHVTDSLSAKKEEDTKLAQAKEKEQKQEEEQLARARQDKNIADSMRKAKADAAKIAKLRDKASKQKELQRMQDSLTAVPKTYTHVELWRKYPKFVFEQPPSGQSFAVDYLNAQDTLDNYNICMLILHDKVQGDALPEPIVSNTQNGASFLLKSINFSGVNCYMRLLISNTNTKTDYLVGPISTKWNQKEGKDYNLFACYTTTYPVLSPHAQREIVLVTRAVNIKDEDEITLHIGDRLQNIELGISITGKLYNQQYNIIRSLKEVTN